MSSVAELGLALAAGSLTTLSPCVFPILPLVVGGAVRGGVGKVAELQRQGELVQGHQR